MRSTTRIQCFDIELLDDKEEYHLGESIVGALVLEPRAGQMISKIRVGIHGIAKVFWNKSNSTPTPANSVTNIVHCFDAEESVYENRRASVPAGPELMRKLATRLGLFGPEEFPFVFKLPERGAPASWAGLYGNIRYWIDAIVEVGGAEYFKETICRAITILPTPNLAEEPVLATQKFPISSLACVTQAAFFTSVTTSKNTCFPGETINLTINVKNPSAWRITSSLCLMQVQTFLATKGLSKQIREVLLKLKGEVVDAHNEREWVLPLTIPPNAVPSMLDCSVIRNGYRVVLRLRIRSLIPQSNETSLPLIILNPQNNVSVDKKSLPVSSYGLLRPGSESTLVHPNGHC